MYLCSCVIQKARTGERLHLVSVSVDVCFFLFATVSCSEETFHILTAENGEEIGNDYCIFKKAKM